MSDGFYVVKAAPARTEKNQPRLGKKTKRAHAEPALSTGYLLPFEIASVHLLVVLIGAAYLARAKRRVQSTTV